MEPSRRHIELWAQVAVDEGWAGEWVEGAIFPRELVAFLAMCEELGVRNIVESGRQDGFSTMAFARYAEEHGGRVISIDLEDDRDRAARCRARLARFDVIEYRTGQAFSLLGSALRDASNAPTALCVDGPKGFVALGMLLAAARYPHVLLLTQHNLAEGTPERRLVERRVALPTHYESYSTVGGAAWDRLSSAEFARGQSLGAVRDLHASSLAMIPLPPTSRWRLVRTLSLRCRFVQPPFVALMWRWGRDDAVRIAYLAGILPRWLLTRLRGSR